jgi:hypothetical protein
MNGIEWDKEYLRKTHEKIEASAVFLSLFTESYKEDPTALVQLVFAMMLEKPIYLLVQKGTKVPKAFEKICDGIEYFETKEDVTKATAKLLKDIRST